MHRIDVPSAATSLPAPSAYGTPGYFQEGNPLTGVDATIVDEDWTNAVQEELVAIVLAAGIALDKTNRAQVLAAIRSLIGAIPHGSQTISATGWFTVPAAVIEVEIWAGGSGSWASVSGTSGGGGSGGGYVAQTHQRPHCRRIHCGHDRQWRRGRNHRDASRPRVEQAASAVIAARPADSSTH